MYALVIFLFHDSIIILRFVYNNCKHLLLDFPVKL